MQEEKRGNKKIKEINISDSQSQDAPIELASVMIVSVTLRTRRNGAKAG